MLYSALTFQIDIFEKQPTEFYELIAITLTSDSVIVGHFRFIFGATLPNRLNFQNILNQLLYSAASLIIR